MERAYSSHRIKLMNDSVIAAVSHATANIGRFIGAFMAVPALATALGAILAGPVGATVGIILGYIVNVRPLKAKNPDDIRDDFIDYCKPCSARTHHTISEPPEKILGCVGMVAGAFAAAAFCEIVEHIPPLQKKMLKKFDSASYDPK